MITTDDYKKLPQLSRIEYLLRRQRVEDTYKGSATIQFMWVVGFLGLFISLFLAILLPHYPKETIVHMAAGFITILRLCLVGIVLCFLLDILVWIRYHKKWKELHEEFFNFKTEPKRGNNVKKNKCH